VVLKGDLDMDAVGEVDAMLRRAFGPFFFRRTLLIDLGAALMLDSTFVSYLVRLAGRVRQAGYDLVLTRPVGQVRRTLALVGMPNLVPVYDSLEQAAELIAAGRVPMIPPPLPFRLGDTV
jgi:anti-anti-sigma factor